MERLQIESKLCKELDAERFIHTQGVMYTAAALAMAHHGNMEKALYAGLLHDCAKCIPNNKKLSMCIEHGIEVTLAEQKSPFLLHAKLGAYLAEKKYDITDEEILHAITVHTTGAPDMNLLDKIIYIADFIEPNRNKASNLEEIRAMAFENLDITMEKILKDTLGYLEKSKGEIDPLTQQTYLYFKEKNHKEAF